jgi:hypothetical protein
MHGDVSDNRLKVTGEVTQRRCLSRTLVRGDVFQLQRPAVVLKGRSRMH